MKKMSILFLLGFLISSISHKVYSQMFWNQACSFTGSNSSYVVVPNSPELNLTGSFTLQAWINPSNIGGTSRGIIAKGGPLGTSLRYALRLTTANRISLITNGASRLTSTASDPIPLNTWTHITATYNAPTNQFRLYIDGLMDTSSVVAGVAPDSNTDSLFIGISGSSTPFNGQLDEIRIWNRSLGTLEVYNYFRTTLGTNSGKYNGLVMSMTFQDDESLGTDFFLYDWTENGNNGTNRGGIPVDLSDRPLTTIATNDCIELDGSGDYLAARDNSTISATTDLTIEAWIYPRAAGNVIVHKGSPSGGPGTNYRLGMNGVKLYAGINGDFGFTSDDTIPLNRWSHVAFTYYALVGSYAFYLNGVPVHGGINPVGNITDGTDSLYIGSVPSLGGDFNGYIDEVKITKNTKFGDQICQYLFRSSDRGSTNSDAIYNFDGYLQSSKDDAPNMHFRNDAGFSHVGSRNDQPLSPMARLDPDFQSGYYLKTSGKRIPAAGNTGTIVDTLKILHNETITDINLFIGINHFRETDLQISLISPNGTLVTVYDNNSATNFRGNVVTIFDDQADSSLVNGRYVQFSGSIKPFNNLNSAFSGGNSAGVWILSVRDEGSISPIDTGRLYGWGIQINNNPVKPVQINTSQLIQGFYNNVSNSMIRDTMRFYFRNAGDPGAVIVDSAKAYLNTNGSASVYPPSISPGNYYFIQLKHRNSVETWGIPIYLDALTYECGYSFLNPITQAYGSNMIQIDNTPVQHAIYNGDVNQDGSVNLSDIILISNDATNFITGYVSTDLTGDNVSNLTDLVLAFNNAANFVSRITP